MRVNKIGKNYEGSEEEIRQRIKHGLSLLKQRMERDVGIEILENVPMNLLRLHETGAGQKLTRVFESSRYAERAQRLHTKWIAIADKEIQERWAEVRQLWLTKAQMKDLDREQAKYDRVHKKSHRSEHVPHTPGRERDFDVLTESNSSFSRDLEVFPNKENDRWYMDAVPRTPRARDTDDSFDDCLFPSESSSYSMLGTPQEKRPRGRPRKNSTPVQSRGGTPGRGRRGRPPIKR